MCPTNMEVWKSFIGKLKVARRRMIHRLYDKLKIVQHIFKDYMHFECRNVYTSLISFLLVMCDLSLILRISLPYIVQYNTSHDIGTYTMRFLMFVISIARSRWLLKVVHSLMAMFTISGQFLILGQQQQKSARKYEFIHTYIRLHTFIHGIGTFLYSFIQTRM